MLVLARGAHSRARRTMSSGWGVVQRARWYRILGLDAVVGVGGSILGSHRMQFQMRKGWVCHRVVLWSGVDGSGILIVRKWASQRN